jgi:hypothetical protein
MSIQTIEKFFTAFQNLNASEMAKIYAPDATFSDEVFNLKNGEAIGQMWAMLVGNITRSGKEHWSFTYKVESMNSASWEAKYLFSAAGRMVVNRVRSTFTFDPYGKVKVQVDQFDFWRWSRQAFGVTGLLLGWNPLFKRKVRAKAQENLSRLIAKGSLAK